MDVIVSLVDFSIVHVVFVFFHVLGSVFFLFTHQFEGLGGEEPVVLGCVLITFFCHSIVGEEFNNSKTEIRPASLLIGLLSLIKFVIGTEMVSIGQVNLLCQFRILLGKHKSIIPVFKSNMQIHQVFEVA